MTLKKKNTYNIKHDNEGQDVAVWLKGHMKCLPMIDRCKVVGMNVVMGVKVVGGKDMVVVRKGMDMNMVDKWTLAVMGGSSSSSSDLGLSNLLA